MKRHFFWRWECDLISCRDKNILSALQLYNHVLLVTSPIVDYRAPWRTFKFKLEKIKKNLTRKNFLCFRKWNFLDARLKNLSYLQKLYALASYFLYISERNFPDLKSKKNNTHIFHIFQEIELSSPKYKKIIIFQRATF